MASNWHDLVGDPSVADALLDRLVATAVNGPATVRELLGFACIE
jgi:hypothetical protein